MSNLKIWNSNFWLLAIAGGLIALQLHLNQLQDGQIKIENLVFWLAALSITWKRRHTLDLNSDIPSTCLGLTLISWVLLRNVFNYANTDILSRIAPLVATLGLFFLASNIQKITQYWRELMIVSLTAFPFEHIFARLDPSQAISIFDAKLSGILLWYLGFNVTQTENIVQLPTGAIIIATSCSSFTLIWFLSQLALVAFLCFPMERHHKILLSFSAVGIAIICNAIRLCLLALLVANRNESAFEYWHGGEGAQIFSTSAMLLFTFTYQVITKKPEPKSQDIY